MSKAVQIRQHGGAEQMELVDVQVGNPGPGEIRIRHHAVGLNFIDVYHRTGLYQLPMPATLGMEAAGIVEEPDNQRAVNAEFAVKAPRLFSTAEYFWMTDEQSNPVSARDIASRGLHAQGGYMVVPRRLELGLLFGRITPDTDIDDAELTELRGVVGYYWQSHGLKLQADARHPERLGEARYLAAVPQLARHAGARTRLPGLRGAERQARHRPHDGPSQRRRCDAG